MNRINQSMFERAKTEASEVLLDSMIAFLSRNGISETQIKSRLNRIPAKTRLHHRKGSFEALTRAYESMGTVLSTWFDSPNFLNCDGSPAPITLGPGPRSLRALLRKSRVRISSQDAIELLKRSPSVEFDGENNIAALRRVFVLPDFDVTRAAIVVPRYTDTLISNSFAYRTGTIKLFERQCSASKINLGSCGPLLRNIKEQGAAFVDSIDEQLEGLSLARKRKASETELGLVVFAWTSTDKRMRPNRSLRARESTRR